MTKSAPFKIALSIVVVLILVLAVSLRESPLSDAYGALPRTIEWALLVAVVSLSLSFAFSSLKGDGLGKLLNSQILTHWILWFTAAALAVVAAIYAQGILDLMTIQEARRDGLICVCNLPGFPLVWIIPLNPMLNSNELALAASFPLFRILLWLAISISTTVLLFGAIPVAIRKRLDIRAKSVIEL